VQVTNLGNSGLKVSRIAPGGMSFGAPTQYGPWTLDDQAAEPVFRQAAEFGITFWGTSNNYGAGSSEEIIGRALRKYASRDDIVLATKLAMPVHPARAARAPPARRSWSRSTRRWDGWAPTTSTSTRSAASTRPPRSRRRWRRCTTWSRRARPATSAPMWAWQFAKMQHAAQAGGWTKFISMQDQYNLLQREEEREMFPLLADQGTGAIPWSPLAAGKVTRPWGEQGTARAEANPATDQFGLLATCAVTAARRWTSRPAWWLTWG
jgi:aryl-alcohol dehydrogenase-like predicted oxidoreductase